MTAIPHPLTGTHDDAHEHAHEHHHDIPFVSKYVFSTDHKVLAFWSTVPAGALMLTSFMMHGGAAAAGWTSYPPLSSLVGEAWSTTWPPAAVWLNFIAWFACFAYVGYYYIHLGNRIVDGIVNV